MVATLNQPQYQPWPMEEQAVALYAGVNGYLDDIPTEDVSRFQDELREHLRADGSIYTSIRDSGDLVRRDDRAAERRAREVQEPLPDEHRARGRVAALASTQDLKRRVRSITNTRKVTKAMELVASARLRRSQMRIEGMRPYADRMLELMAGVVAGGGRGAPAAARAARERREDRDRADHGRPRPRRRLQRAGDPPLARADARGAGRRPAGRAGSAPARRRRRRCASAGST